MTAVLPQLAEGVATAAEALSVAAVALGLAQAVYILVVSTVRREGADASRHAARHALGRWLGLALELALAADIVGTIIAPTWDELGKLSVIVVLRTALNYFLARELAAAAPASAKPA